MDGTEWRGKEGRGRVAVSEGSRRQMREMVAVMGERESGEEGMFTTGNEYDILGEEEQGERWEDRKKATAKAPGSLSPVHRIRRSGFFCSSDELRNWG